jgi:hypothetical protein
MALLWQGVGLGLTRFSGGPLVWACCKEDRNRDVHEDSLASPPHRSARPGEIITFGNYPLTAEGADTTPIRWRVIQNSGRELFILSESILDCRRYDREYVDVTWRDCDLRKWLNDEFYDAAFDAAEKGLVNTTLCTENGEGSPDTEDNFSLLSIAEVKGPADILGKAIHRAAGTDFCQGKKGRWMSFVCV